MDNDYNQMQKEDPDYSEQALIDYVRKLFTEMQTAWEKGDITSVRYGFEHDTWERFNTQLQMKNQRGETTHVRDIQFERTMITDFATLNAQKDQVDVVFSVAYNVWVTNKDGMNIQGTPSTRHQMIYKWKMERPVSARKSQPADSGHCPNCGAEMDVTAFAECPFCHSQIKQPSRNWLICDIHCISQKTISS